jgi:hypothetical protein
VPGMALGASFVAASSQYANGDENNADRKGRVPGYFVVNLDAQYALTPHVTLFAQIDNLFDRHTRTSACWDRTSSPGRSAASALPPGSRPSPSSFARSERLAASGRRSRRFRGTADALVSGKGDRPYRQHDVTSLHCISL